MIAICNAFEEKIPKDVDIEILQSVHTSLHTPSLAPGQFLTGFVMSKIFGNSKPVYIRPSKKILFQPDEIERNRQQHKLPSNPFDDEDSDEGTLANSHIDVNPSGFVDMSAGKLAKQSSSSI